MPVLNLNSRQTRLFAIAATNAPEIENILLQPVLLNAYENKFHSHDTIINGPIGEANATFLVVRCVGKRGRGSTPYLKSASTPPKVWIPNTCK